jgi:fatty acid desaturase
MPNEDENRNEPGKREDRDPARNKTIGQLVRERTLYAAPTIIIVYPLVGWFVGWLTVRYLHWPFWVPIITMVAAVIQAIRELEGLSKRIYDDDK